MAEVVVAHHDEALGGEITGEGLIAAYVLVDAVRDLYDAV